MRYTLELIALAFKFEQGVLIELSNDKIKVHIAHLRESDEYLRKPIAGYGLTVEDACQDFFRRARGEILVHDITDVEIEVI